MKKNGLLILTLIAFISCSTKKLIVTPVNSERGDALFGLIVPDNNYGKLEDIHIYSWTQGGKLNVNRVLIDFNLNEISTIARIDSAYLSLYFNPTSTYDKIIANDGNQGQDSIIIQRVISDWHERDVTWNKQPETTKENQVIIAKLENTRADYIDINVTGIIQDMVKNKDRYGLLIRHYNEVPYNVVFFASSDHPDKTLHPKLRIYYKER